MTAIIIKPKVLCDTILVIKHLLYRLITPTFISSALGSRLKETVVPATPPQGLVVSVVSLLVYSFSLS